MRGKYLGSYYQENFDPDVCANDYGPPENPQKYTELFDRITDEETNYLLERDIDCPW